MGAIVSADKFRDMYLSYFTDHVKNNTGNNKVMVSIWNFVSVMTSIIIIIIITALVVKILILMVIIITVMTLVIIMMMIIIIVVLMMSVMKSTIMIVDVPVVGIFNFSVAP